jgi:hypothetical protein
VNRVQRLVAGEVLFLPDADWMLFKQRSGPLYSQVRRAGKYLHVVKDGTGLRIWADDQPARPNQPLLGRAAVR